MEDNMSYSYGWPLPSGKVITVEHGSIGSFIKLDGETWDLRTNIPDSVWNKLSEDDRSEVVSTIDDARFEYYSINQ